MRVACERSWKWKSVNTVQVVAALAYLEERKLHHGRLACSQIYLHPSGKVKLGRSQPYVVPTPD